ncbi:MarC family protein [Candidatus Woesearchaeota archaeon]|nr:MarC family protein [Candidatus Woesearchaeota archaeon]
MIQEFLQAFFSIFVVMDSLGNVPVFWKLSGKLKKSEKKLSVNKAITIAGIILLVFLFFGESLLGFFGVTIHSFKVAGGIILLAVGVQMVLSINFREKSAEKYEFAVVPLATPLITGPGVITTVIILVNTFGILITFVASALNLLLAWVILSYSGYFYRFFGRQGSDAMGRIMGLILSALAIEFIKSGWMGIV